MTHPLLEQFKKDMNAQFSPKCVVCGLPQIEAQFCERYDCPYQPDQAARDANGIMEDCDE